MSNKKEIQIGDVISTKKLGEKVLKVEDIRVVEGVKKFYVTAEGVNGVHAVSEAEVDNHATAEEYAVYLAEQKAEKNSVEIGNGSVDESDSEPQQSSEEGKQVSTENTSSGESTEPSSMTTSGQEDLTSSSPQPSEPPQQQTEPQQPEPQQPKQNSGNKNQQSNGNKRRV